MAEERKKRILVVEDEPDIQEMIHTMLQRVGWETVAALDVPQAVNVLRTKPLPDVVLLDLMLPGIDGFELLRQMRAKPVFDNLPVIIVSALADPESIRKGLDLGADRYVTKVGIATNLIKTVQEVLRNGRRKAE
ncbi:MAG: response regulator [Anaerolineae bacterium]|nr:response regulator [Anaerolineae bacterium]